MGLLAPDSTAARGQETETQPGERPVRTHGWQSYWTDGWSSKRVGFGSSPALAPSLTKLVRECEKAERSIRRALHYGLAPSRSLPKLGQQPTPTPANARVNRGVGHLGPEYDSLLSAVIQIPPGFDDLDELGQRGAWAYPPVPTVEPGTQRRESDLADVRRVVLMLRCMHSIATAVLQVDPGVDYLPLPGFSFDGAADASGTQRCGPQVLDSALAPPRMARGAADVIQQLLAACADLRKAVDVFETNNPGTTSPSGANNDMAYAKFGCVVQHIDRARSV